METINNEGKGRLERLEAQVQQNLAETKDYMFSDYLRKMNQRIIEEKHRIDLLQDELDRNCRQYQQKQVQVQEPVQVQEAVQVQEPVQVQETVQVQEPVQVQETVQIQEAVQNYQPPVFNQEQHFATQATIQQAWQQHEVKKKKSTEFTIGATVLSVVGGAFILTALVMLAMNYMNDVVKGIGMYAISLVVFLLSELLIYKKFPKMGAVLTGIGIGGIYISTALSYSILQLFNEWIMMLLLLLITAGIFWLNRKRESTILRVFSFVICYICFLPLINTIGEDGFVMWILATFMINVLCIILPVGAKRDLLDRVQMGVNTFFTFLCWVQLDDNAVAMESLLLLYFSSFFIIQLLLATQIKRNIKNIDIPRPMGVGAFVVYWLCNFFLLSMTAIAYEDIFDNQLVLYGNLIAVAIVCAVLSVVLWKSKHKWHLYIYMTLFVMYPFSECAGISITACVLIAMAITKVLALQNVKSLRVWDVCLTTLVAMEAIGETDPMWSYVYLVAIIISILLIKHWQTYYEIILVGALLLFTYDRLVFELQIPAIVGILLMAVLLFNNVKRFQGKNIILFNVFALVVQIICNLVLMLPEFEQEYLIYIFTLVFSVATILLTFHEHYHMEVKGKNIFLAVYLSYMAFIFDWEWPIINSIFMMLIALVCVGVGFADKQKGIRIYGLVLSLVICGKIALYDFLGAATLQKIILFFSVGVIALVISGIYIILERKNSLTEESR